MPPCVSNTPRRVANSPRRVASSPRRVAVHRRRVACAVLVLAATASAQSPIWRATNPGGGGWFERVAAGPTGLIIACSDLSGAYRSQDRGRTWQAIGANRGIDTTHTSCVGFHRTNPRVLYLGTESGVYSSTDLGESFVHVLKSGYVESIHVAPSDASIAYAARHPKYDSSHGEIWSTQNFGTSWTRTDKNFPRGHRILELLVSHTDARVVYALTGVGRFAKGPRNVFRSTDAGVNWTAIGASFQNRVIDIALGPGKIDTLYASVDDANRRVSGHLWRSTDRGAKWVRLSQRGGYIWPDRRDSRVLRMIESRYPYPWDKREGIWESRNGGSGAWTKTASVAKWDSAWSTAYWAFGATSHYGGHGEDYSDPNAMFWVNAQFAYGTFDGGRTAQQLFSNRISSRGRGSWLSRGIDNVVIVDFAIGAGDPAPIYAGFLDLGAWRSLDRGRSWTPINDKTASGGWQGAGGNTWTILADPTRRGAVWSAQSGEHEGASTLLFSTDSGSTWSKVGKGLPQAALCGLSLDPRSSPTRRRMFVTAVGSVFGSVDGGVNWTPRTHKTGLRFTHVDASNSNIVYAGGEDGLWQSTSAGDAGSWTEVGVSNMRGSYRGLPGFWWKGVHDIATHAKAPGRVFVSANGKRRGLYRSDDNGKSWTLALQDDFLRDIAIDPIDPNTIYLTSSRAVDSGGYDPRVRGVLLSRDGGKTWNTRNEGLVWPMAIPIVIDPADNKTVFLGSPGTGIHKLGLQTLRVTPNKIDPARGGAAIFTIDAGAAARGEAYLLMASMSGCSPGVDPGFGNILPLNADFMLESSIQHANSAWFVNSAGNLDAQGRATSMFVLPPGVLRVFLGWRVTFAYATVSRTSNPVTVNLIP